MRVESRVQNRNMSQVFRWTPAVCRNLFSGHTTLTGYTGFVGRHRLRSGVFSFVVRQHVPLHLSKTSPLETGCVNRRPRTGVTYYSPVADSTSTTDDETSGAMTGRKGPISTFDLTLGAPLVVLRLTLAITTLALREQYLYVVWYFYIFTPTYLLPFDSGTFTDVFLGRRLLLRSF